MLPVEGSVLLFLGGRQAIAWQRVANDWHHLQTRPYAQQTQRVEEMTAHLENWELQSTECPMRSLHVVVSDRWIPSACLSWLAEALGGAGNHALQSHLRLAGHAAVSEKDIFRIDEAPWRSTRLLLAFPRALVDAVRALAVRHQAHAVGISSLAITAQRMIPRRIARTMRRLALLEPHAPDVPGSATDAVLLHLDDDGHLSDISTLTSPAGRCVDHSIRATMAHLGWTHGNASYVGVDVVNSVVTMPLRAENLPCAIPLPLPQWSRFRDVKAMDVAIRNGRWPINEHSAIAAAVMLACAALFSGPSMLATPSSVEVEAVISPTTQMLAGPEFPLSG